MRGARLGRGQIVLVCDESKTKSVRPTEARVPNHNHGWRGHGCTWLAVLKHGGTLGACFKSLLTDVRCTCSVVALYRAARVWLVLVASRDRGARAAWQRKSEFNRTLPYVLYYVQK